jgi:hypothetical protein
MRVQSRTMRRKQNKVTPRRSADGWKKLFGEALMENDPVIFGTRLRDAKNAIMDRIEDSMRTASQSERRLLLTALNTLVELQRATPRENPVLTTKLKTLGTAA